MITQIVYFWLELFSVLNLSYNKLLLSTWDLKFFIYFFTWYLTKAEGGYYGTNIMPQTFTDAPFIDSETG